VVVSGLDIEQYTNGSGHAVLRLAGELDADSVAALERAVEGDLAAQSNALTLDLSRLMFIDSTGMAAVVLVSRLCERDDRRLEIVPGSRAVQRLFEITGLIDVLPFRPAPQEGS
jgi:anti-sigma B factor antagonist